jgi:hypothetical protein
MVAPRGAAGREVQRASARVGAACQHGVDRGARRRTAPHGELTGVTGPKGWAAPDDGGAANPPPAPATDAPAAGPSSGTAPAGWQTPAGWGAQPPQAGPPGWGAGQSGWGSPPPPERKPGVVPLRPLGLGELLDGAVTLVRRYPRPTLGLSAGIALVTTLLNIPLLLQLFDSPLFDATAFTPGTSIDVEGELGSLFAGLGATSLLSFLAGVVLAGIITAVVGRAVLGQPMSLAESWSAVRPLLLRLLGLAVVVLLAVWGTFVAGVILAVLLGAALGGPGVGLGVLLVIAAAVLAVHLYVRLSLAASAMVLERAGLGTALRRSATLVKGDWWRVFGILLLVLVITSFISQVLQTPFAISSFSSALSGEAATFGTTDVLLQSIGSALALTVIAPFGAAVRALLYVDRRMRAEGLDVALAAAAAPPA